jgi:hypothetical protein
LPTGEQERHIRDERLHLSSAEMRPAMRVQPAGVSAAPGGFVREFGRQMFARFGATLLALRAVMFVRTGTTRGP